MAYLWNKQIYPQRPLNVARPFLNLRREGTMPPFAEWNGFQTPSHGVQWRKGRGGDEERERERERAKRADQVTSRHSSRKTIDYSKEVTSNIQRTLTVCLLFKDTELRMETSVKQESSQHGMLGLKSLSERIQKVTLKGVIGNQSVPTFSSQINKAVQLKKENAWDLPVRPDGYQSLPESHFPYTFLGMYSLVENIALTFLLVGHLPKEREPVFVHASWSLEGALTHVIVVNEAELTLFSARVGRRKGGDLAVVSEKFSSRYTGEASLAEMCREPLLLAGIMDMEDLKKFVELYLFKNRPLVVGYNVINLLWLVHRFRYSKLARPLNRITFTRELRISSKLEFIEIEEFFEDTVGDNPDAFEWYAEKMQFDLPTTLPSSSAVHAMFIARLWAHYRNKMVQRSWPEVENLPLN